ncbi:MAG: hypothetical protein AAF990_16125 [Bacteroidota bacterium]
MENLKDNDSKQLTKFQKDHFDEESIWNNASELKYLKETTSILDRALKEPSDDFVKHFTYQALG